MIYWELFYSFCLVGVFCVGGGYASVPLIQHQVIELHQWMTLQEFLDIFAISQTTPGPIGINAATFVGTKVAGLGGAVAATLGFVAPSLVIMIILAKLLQKYGSITNVRSTLNGLRPAVVALVASAGVMFLTLVLWDKQKLPVNLTETDWIGLMVVIAAFVATKKKYLGVIETIMGSGLVYLVVQLAVK